MVRCTSWRSFFQLLFFRHHGWRVLCYKRQTRTIHGMRITGDYLHTSCPFPSPTVPHLKIRPISTAGKKNKNFAFLSHTGVLEARIFVGKETTCIIMGTSLVNWLRTCIFTASTRSRRGGGWGLGGLLDESLLPLCCSSQWILGPASSKQCGEMSRCPHVVAAWAVKLREWALWLAGSSFPFINNKCYHKIKTVTKRRRRTKSGQSLPVSEGYTCHAPVRRPVLCFWVVVVVVVFFISLSDNCQVRTQLRPTQTRFCSTIHSGHTRTHTRYTSHQCTHKQKHIRILTQGIASINKRDAAGEFVPRQQLCLRLCSDQPLTRSHMLCTVTGRQQQRTSSSFAVAQDGQMCLPGWDWPWFWSVYTGYTLYTQTLILTPYTLMSLHSSLGCLSLRSS